VSLLHQRQYHRFCFGTANEAGTNLLTLLSYWSHACCMNVSTEDNAAEDDLEDNCLARDSPWVDRQNHLTLVEFKVQ